MRDRDTGTRRFVAIRPGALGDTLLVFPALALLRRAHPGTHITLVARRDVLPLAYTWGLADAVLQFDSPEWLVLFGDVPPMDSPLRTMLAGAVTLAWLSDTDGRVAANLRALGAETVAIGPGRPREDIQTHAALQLAAPLAELGIPVPVDTAVLYDVLPPLPLNIVSDATSAPLPQVSRRPVPTVVALHVGSGSAAKRWPPERFAALAEEIARLGPRLMLIEGPQDGDVTNAVLADTERHGTRTVVARDLDPPALAWLLTGCAAYVGNDSGVSHLAGLLGLHTLALFGPTDPVIWSPLGPRVRTLRSPTGRVADLPVASVAAALHDLLSL